MTAEKPKKIVLLYGQLITAGGAERVLIEEARHLGAKCEARILAFSLRDEALYGHTNLNVELLRVKKGYGLIHPLLSRATALRRRLREICPDLVIGCTGSGMQELYLATLFTSIPYILHLHGSVFWWHYDLTKYALIHRHVFDEIRESVIGHREFIPKKPECSIY